MRLMKYALIRYAALAGILLLALFSRAKGDDISRIREQRRIDAVAAERTRQIRNMEDLRTQSNQAAIEEVNRQYNDPARLKALGVSQAKARTKLEEAKLQANESMKSDKVSKDIQRRIECYVDVQPRSVWPKLTIADSEKAAKLYKWNPDIQRWKQAKREFNTSIFIKN